MTDNMTWAVPGRVIHWQLGEESTVEDLIAANAAAHAYLDEKETEKVHMLLDMTHFDMARSVLNTVKLQNSLDFFKSPHWGTTSIYGNTNRAVGVMMQMLANILGGAIRFSDTRAEAYAELRRLDPTLPPWDEVEV